MSYDLQKSLNNQPLANDFGVGNQSAQVIKSGGVQVINLYLPIGEWRQVFAHNPNRKFLHIKNLGGDLGYCRLEMSLDNQGGNTFDIDDFNPRFVPINAIFLRATDNLGTGSNQVSVQILEG